MKVSYHGHERSRLDRTGEAEAVFEVFDHESTDLLWICDDVYHNYGIPRLIDRSFIGEADSDAEIRWVEK